MSAKERYVPQKLMNHYFIYLWIVTFALQMGQNIFNSTLSVYALSLGYSNTFAGSLFVPYLCCAVIARVVSGLISDTTSRRLAMMIGCASFLLGCVLFNIPSLAVLPFIMMAARGTHGFGYACGSTAYSVAVVDCVPKEKMAMGIGVNWTAQGAAQALAGVIIAVMVVGSNYKPIFWVATVCLAVAELFCILCNYEGTREKKEKKKFSLKETLNGMFEISALPCALITLVYYFGVAACSLFALAVAESRGISNGGYFYTACAFGMVACNLFLVKLQARFGTIKTLLPTFALMGAADIIVSVCTSFGVFLFAGLLYGLGLGVMPVIQNEAVKRLDVFRRGAGTSTLFLAMDLAMGLGPLVWGAVSDATNYSVAFTLSTVCIVIAMIMVVVVFRPQKNK